jgi:hypothetical protein
MAKFAGQSANVTLSGAAGTWAAGLVVGNLRDWTATITRNLVDATTKSDSGFTSDVYGPSSCEGTVTMAADDTTALSIAAGTDPTVELNLFSTTRKISGTAKLMTMDLDGFSMPPPGALPVVTFRFRFQGTFTLA